MYGYFFIVCFGVLIFIVWEYMFEIECAFMFFISIIQSLCSKAYVF